MKTKDQNIFLEFMLELIKVLALLAVAAFVASLLMGEFEHALGLMARFQDAISYPVETLRGLL